MFAGFVTPFGHAAFPLGDAAAVRALFAQAPPSYHGHALSDGEMSWLAETLAHIASEEKLVDVLTGVVKQLHTRPYIEVPLHDLLLGGAWQRFLAQQPTSSAYWEG